MRKWKETDEGEIYAFLGLLIIAGANLWSEHSGRPIFCALMTENRLQSRLRFCRFDDLHSRTDRMKSDKLAAFQDIWNMFMDNIKKVYKLSFFLTVVALLDWRRHEDEAKQISSISAKKA
ncbi:hypothetical protein T4D_11083 [Trichinella pseudospiralis]|uniref:PiggyBac transposable element-derived protein domain-containing protein n=1 Tax=Trichinella pseudospiralis TaxID=6337 RepID=A0A0V1FJF2_TRIPS|nr:hypothetical protein T4D_11083 [Trichinella pseudospiralis]